MVKVVDTEDLKSFAYIRRGGSSPSVSTILKGGNMSVEVIGALVVVGLVGAFLYLRSRK